MTNSLLDYSLDYSSTAQLDSMADSLRLTGRQFYQHMRDDLRKGARSGELEPQKFSAANRATWPEAVKTFEASPDGERMVPGGTDGNRLDYLVRHGSEI